MNLNFWKNTRKSSYPREITEYLSVNKSTEDTKQHFVIFDTESSSLTISTAQLLSIGAVKVTDNCISVKETFHFFIKTQNSGANGNVHIHEIMKNGKEEKKNVKEVLLKFLEFIGNAVLVAHHARHDVGLVNRYLSEIFPGIRLLNLVIDTADLAIEVDKKANSNIAINAADYSLDALAKRYNIAPLERHTALGDAYTTALLFLKIK